MKRVIAIFIFLSFFLFGCTPSGAMTAISAGGEWFLNAENDSFIYYKYFPFTDKWDDDHHSLREMGALWSITQLWHFLDDSRYEDLADKGFAFFENSFVEDTEGNFIYVNITPDKIKLGYNAFAILTLLELEHENKDELLKKLGNGILSLQQEGGSFNTFFYSERGTGTDYYPGEALLALVRLYEYTGDESYYEAIQDAFEYYSKVYWEKNPNTAFVPWQTQANYRLYLLNGDEAVADFIFDMNDYMIDQFKEGDSCSNFDYSDGIVHAVYIEGMLKAYQLADELGEWNRERCYKNYIQGGLRSVMALQSFDEAPDYGGFFGSDRDKIMQVDRNQHAVMALMGAYSLGLVE